MKRIYLIQHNIIDDSVFQERIKTLGTWMSYFPKSWIVESDLKAADIYKIISQDYEKQWILIMELNKTNYWGVMPNEAWDWLTKRKNEN